MPQMLGAGAAGNERRAAFSLESLFWLCRNIGVVIGVIFFSVFVVFIVVAAVRRLVGCGARAGAGADGTAAHGPSGPIAKEKKNLSSFVFKKRVLCSQRVVAVRASQVVAGALRWQEKSMQMEVVRAALYGPSGAEVVCRLLEEKNLSSEAEELLVAGLCSFEVQAQV
jgi:hypothetical protein